MRSLSIQRELLTPCRGLTYNGKDNQEWTPSTRRWYQVQQLSSQRRFWDQESAARQTLQEPPSSTQSLHRSRSLRSDRTGCSPRESRANSKPDCRGISYGGLFWFGCQPGSPGCQLTIFPTGLWQRHPVSRNDTGRCTICHHRIAVAGSRGKQ